MKDFQWSKIRTLNDAEAQLLQASLNEELNRRKHIAELVEKANEAIHELFGELRDCDLVDITDSYTDEVLVKNYCTQDYYLDPDYDWSYPQFSVRCGQRSE